ncbi:hypothetical protein Tco_0027448 [Tanacetum coccineum]
MYSWRADLHSLLFGSIHIYEAKKERSSEKDKKHTELPSTPEMEIASDYEGTAITPGNEPEKLKVLVPESSVFRPASKMIMKNGVFQLLQHEGLM